MKYPDVSCSSEIRQPGKRGWWTCVCYVSPTSLAACSLTSKEEKQEVVRSAPTILQAGHSIYHRKSFFFPPVFSSVQKPNHYYSLSNYPISAFPCTKCEQKRCAKILRPFFYTLTDMRTPNARGTSAQTVQPPHRPPPALCPR